ncbi:GDSL esterase/lipase 5 [Senna tora]|uniref:GDSL esterase/lipase 5 n=1 Tax=Senna tora TaxID=362788 RepID=A0A834WE86_9FABA|nr:GDSL esterase/lipase 5 [Senna tora]
MAMAGGRSRVGFLILCVMMMICVGGSAYGEVCIPRKHAALFVFGASLFDTGNNNYINTSAISGINIFPYGQTFFKYPSGRFTDGRVIPDFIAEYARLPLPLPYLFPAYQTYTDGTNFASGGSGALVETHRGFVIDLKTQLANLRNVNRILRNRHGDAETNKLVSNSIYLFNVGTNDYTARVTENSSVLLSYSADEYVKIVVGNLTSVVQDIYKMGGRKFGFLGIAPLGCLPSLRARVNGTAGSCLEEANELAKQHNKELSLVLQNLERKLQGFKYSFTNYYDLVSQLMNFPSKYGFKEGMVACCGSGPYRGYSTCGGRMGVKYELCENPSDHVFFDPSHYSERAAQIIAHQMWSGNGNTTGPYNLRSLFQD